MPICQKLKTMVKSFDQNLRLRNVDSKHEKIESAAGTKKGKCSKGDQCCFRHESNDRAQKPEHNVATPSEPTVSRGRSVSRKRRIQGKSNHGVHSSTTVQIFLKGNCTQSSCEYWHPPECQFFENRNGLQSRDECLFLHQKLYEQPNKKAKERLLVPQKKGKRRQECCGYCENCISIGLCQAKLGCVRFSVNNSLGET